MAESHARRYREARQTKSSDGLSQQPASAHQSQKRSPREYSEVLASCPPTRNGFTAFSPLPEEISFDSQESNEKILLFLRQHPIVNLPWILIAILMLLAPFVLGPILSPFLKIPANYSFVLGLGWYLITAGFVIERMLMWLFNSFLITDERMIDIDFNSLIYKEVNYAQLDKIQDVTVSSGGVVNAFFDIGSVFVQTAGEVPEFVFDNIAHPSRVAKLLNELTIEEEQEQIEGRVR